MPRDPHVTWILRYNGTRVLITKLSASIMIEVDHVVRRVDFYDNRTPDGLMNLLEVEVPLAFASVIHSE